MNSEFLQLRALAHPYNIILSTISITFSAFTIIFCLLMILSTLFKGYKSLDYSMKLAAITVLFDLLEGVVGLVLSICCLLNIDDYLVNSYGCQLVYLFIILVDLTSFNLTGIVALERYLIICQGIKLTKKNLILLITSFTMLNVTGCIVAIYFNGIGILPATVFCFLKYDNIGGIISQAIALISNGTSVSMIYFCYSKIIIQRTLQLEELLELCPQKHTQIKRQRNITILKSSSLILISTVANGPYCIITLISMFNPSFFTPKVDTIRTLSVMLNMVTNSLLLLVMRPDLLSDLFRWKGISNQYKRYSDN